jgi:multidrug efflux pump subunit AcrA (membrane-fusion protein)
MKHIVITFQQRIIQPIVNIFKHISQRLLQFIDRKPFLSFFGLLGILVLCIVIGSILRKPSDAVTTEHKEPQEVDIFSIGAAPKMKFSGRVEKSGVITIPAQTGGIVNRIDVQPGQQIQRGNRLISLSSNYNGASIPSLSRQIAAQNYKQVEENYPLQMEMLAKRREIAQKTDAQADKLRDIASKSIDDTNSQISLNEQIVNSLHGQIEYLEQTNTGGNNDQTILQMQQAKSGVLSGLSALKNALRTTEYQVSNENEPARLSDVGRELTEKQLDIEEKSINMSKEIAQLNLRIAQVGESLLYPSAPSAGVVERVFVRPGQSVGPGTPLLSFVSDKNIANIIVKVSPEIAKQLSRIDPSTLRIGDKQLELVPRYVSTEPTDGTLHSVLFTLSEEDSRSLADGSNVRVEIPIGLAQSTASVPYVPIDAVFQTQDTSIIYIATQSAEGNYIVQGREVELGPIFGSFVEVQQGLFPTDQVILNRNVIAGDAVTFSL